MGVGATALRRRRAVVRPGWRQRPVVAEGKLGEVIYDIGVGAVLFIDFQNAAVFGVAGRKDPGWFAGQKDAGVGPAAVGEATNDNHGGTVHGTGQKSNRRG